MKYIILISLFLFFGNCNAKEQVLGIEATIIEMESLIEKNMIHQLLSDHAYFEEGVTIPTKIHERKINGLKKLLIALKNLKPELSKNNTLATYQVPDISKPVRFIKINSYWKLMD